MIENVNPRQPRCEALAIVYIYETWVAYESVGVLHGLLISGGLWCKIAVLAEEGRGDLRASTRAPAAAAGCRSLCRLGQRVDDNSDIVGDLVNCTVP